MPDIRVVICLGKKIPKLRKKYKYVCFGGEFTVFNLGRRNQMSGFDRAEVKIFDLLILTLCVLPGALCGLLPQGVKYSDPILRLLMVDGSSVYFLHEQVCL